MMKSKIYEYIYTHKEKYVWTTQDIAQIFNLSSYQAHHYLKQLHKRKALERSTPQQGASAFWMLPYVKATLESNGEQSTSRLNSDDET